MDIEIRRGLGRVASHTDALLHEALGEEIRQLAGDPDARGAALAWLLGHLLADEPRLRLADVTDRLAMGLADPAADALWQHARAAAAFGRRP